MKNDLIFDNCTLAVICEGNSEKTYIDFMLDNDLLIFTRKNLIREEILGNKYRSAKTFTKEYLTMSYEKSLEILLIQDDETKFKISRPYDEKVRKIHYIITAPEIEMLVIIHKGLYKKYKAQSKKPSLFLAEYEKKSTATIKSYRYILSVFDVDSLIKAISEYKRITKDNGNLRLYDLLKPELKK